jgi:hypothetical protein
MAESSHTEMLQQLAEGPRIVERIGDLPGQRILDGARVVSMAGMDF